MANSPIERAARAMVEADGHDPDERVLNENSFYEARWALMMGEARRIKAVFDTLIAEAE